MTELSELYKSYFHQEPARVQMLGGAASNRHYYRLYHSLSADSGAVIGVIGENAKEKISTIIKVRTTISFCLLYFNFYLTS